MTGTIWACLVHIVYDNNSNIISDCIIQRESIICKSLVQLQLLTKHHKLSVLAGTASYINSNARVVSLSQRIGFLCRTKLFLCLTEPNYCKPV